MTPSISGTKWLLALWALLVGASLLVRPLFPVDETRYLSVAWEMWLRGDFLVPHLNGETYSHKPPLLFWLMQLGWSIFGVNEWTPRLLAPLFGLGVLLLLRKVSTLLWPGREFAANVAPWLLLGCGFWAVFDTLTMFDVPLAFFVLLGIYGLLLAQHSGQTLRAWLWLGLALGGGLLIKGPVIFLHLLPVALLAPLWWDPKRAKPRWSSWYSGILLAVLLGAAIVLSWAIPAAMTGGDAYRNAIFWGQTGGRMVQSFAHSLPVWWYLQSLPLLLWPWWLWPPFWSVAGALKLSDRGVRFCLAWVLPVFVAFSLISGKRLHYLLPIFPALALLLARAADGWRQDKYSGAHWPAVLAVALAGLALAVFAVGNRYLFLWWPDLAPVSPLWGLALAALAYGSYKLPVRNAVQSGMHVCVLSIALLIFISGAYFSAMRASYDLRLPAVQVAALLKQNKPVAHYGKYHGQLHFLGRLEQPLPVFDTAEALLPWMRANPYGYVVFTYRKDVVGLDNLADYRYPLKGRQIGLFANRTLLQQGDVQGLLP